jgi:hypothetical protein
VIGVVLADRHDFAWNQRRFERDRIERKHLRQIFTALQCGLDRFDRRSYRGERGVAVAYAIEQRRRYFAACKGRDVEYRPPDSSTPKCPLRARGTESQ